MINSVKRALDILLIVSDNCGKPVPLTNIAQAMEMNASTCAHIIKTLAESGFLERVDRRSGYILGHNAYYLTRDGSYKTKLTELIKPELEHFMELYNENIVVSVLRDGDKIIICKLESDNLIQASSDVLAFDTAETPTGRLLLAYSNEYQLARYIEKYGLPRCSDWGPFENVDDFKRSLSAIRGKDILIMENKREIFHAACPVLYMGRIILAVGVFLPRMRCQGEHAQKLLGGLKETAARITERINKQIIWRMNADGGNQNG